MKEEKLIRFNEPYLSGNELEYISRVFELKHFQGNGTFTKEVQNFLSNYLSVNKVLLTDSCTSALEISALLLKQGPDDEVIIPSYTFSSTASAFARAGYKIRFVEVDPITMMLDVTQVSKLVNQNTRAVVAVHYAGFPCEIETLSELCDKYKVDLIEDGAQVLGSRVKGRNLGTFGRLACFSFHETKNLHCGLGGALIINDPKLEERATYIWERGTNRDAVLRGAADKYTWVEVGGSFYPSELQAAFLLAQLHSIEENFSKRKSIFKQYESELSSLRDNKNISFLTDDNDDIEINYHAFFIVFRTHEDCEDVRKALLLEEIHAYIGYVPLHSSPVGQKMGYSADSLPITEDSAKKVLRLPFHNNLTDSQVSRICFHIKRYFDV